MSLPTHAQSLAPQGITLQGRIIKPDSTPLEAASVTFTIEVRSPDPDDCLLYTENQTQVMTGSSGIFSFSIGSGSRSGTNFENVSTMAQVFNNASTTISPVVCTSGATSYSPVSTHKRKVRLSFDDGSGPQLIAQAMDVQSVPYALYADTLQGKPASGYLQVNTTSGKALSQVNLESVFQSSSYVTELLALIAGTSTQYATSGGGGGNFNFGTGKLYVDGTSGNVGVGTTTPAYLLDVTKSQNASTTINVANANGGTTAAANVLTTSDAGTTQMSTVSTAAGGYGRISSNSQSLALDAQNASGFLSFRTGAAPTERMRITSAGNVGIGTSTPAARLEVVGGPVSVESGNDARFSGGSDLNWRIGRNISSLTKSLATFNALEFASGGSPGEGIALGPNGGNAILELANSIAYFRARVGIGTTTPSTDLQVYNTGTPVLSVANATNAVNINHNQVWTTGGPLYINYISGSNTIMNPTAGNVGIGTTSPVSPLTVSSAATSGTQIQIDNPTAAPMRAGITLSKAGNPQWIFGNDFNQSGTNDFFIYDAAQSQNRLYIGTSGNVGIGTTSPNAPLSFGTGVVDKIRLFDSGAGASYGAGIASGEMQFYVPAAGHVSFNAGGNLQSSGTNELMRIAGNGNVGIGTTAPSVSLDLGSKNDAFRLPNGTTAQEPASPTAGLIRYNTNSGTPPGWVEFYNGSAWVNLVGNSTAGNLSNVGNITGTGAVTISPGGTTQNLNLSNTTGGAVNVTTSAGNIVLQPGGIGAVTVPNATASIGTTSGALVVGGGIGVAGAINAGGAIATSSTISAGISLIAPALYGSTLASQNLSIDSTSNAAKGNVTIAPSGGNVGIGTATPAGTLNVHNSLYTSGQVLFQNGTSANPPTYPSSFAPSLVVQSSETTGSRPLFFGYVNGAAWDGFVTTGACGSFSSMCFDFGNGSNVYTALKNVGTTLQIGGGDDGNFSNVIFANSGAVSMGSTTTGNPLSVSGAGGTGYLYPALAVSVNSDAVFTSTSIALASNLSAGNAVISAIGKDVTTSNNAAYTGFHYNSSGSTSNFMTFGFTGSNNLMSLTASGNVGIGTTTPNAMLNILGPASGTPDLFNVTANNSSSFRIDYYGNVYSPSIIPGGGDMVFRYDSNVSAAAVTTKNGASLYLTSDANGSIILKPAGTGKIGLGTTSPIDPISIGTAPAASATHALVNLSNTALVGGNTNGTYLGANPASNAADFINFQTAGTSKFKVDNLGIAYVGGLYTSGYGGIIAYDSNVSSTAYTSFGDTYITSATAGGSGNIILKPGGIGNVGIGTLSPATTLDVNTGNIRIAKTGALWLGGDQYGSIRIDDSPAWYGSLSNVMTFKDYSGAYVFQDSSTATNQMALRVANSGSMPSLGGINLTMFSTTYTDSVTAASGAVGYASSFNGFMQPTLNATNTNVISPTVSNLQIAGAPLAGTHETLTNSIALDVNAGVLNSHVTNGIGLTVEAPTTAVNNYAAIFSGGNVGIGTAAPGAAVEILGANSSTDLLRVTADPANYGGQFKVDQYGDAYFHGGAKIRYDGTLGNSVVDGGSSHLYLVTSTSGKNIVLLPAASGNVGIGTAVPTYGLHLNGTDNNKNMLISGGSKGMRFYTLSTGSTIEGVDNSGTGSYQPLSVGGSVLQFLASGSEKMRVDSSGNVGIGTTGPSEKLHVVGNLRVQGSTDCTLGNGAGGTSCSSDIRLKSHVVSIESALDKILSLRGVEFDWNEKSQSPGRHDIGVIAQDVEKVFPTAVMEDSQTKFKKVDYAVLVAPLIQAMKALNEEIQKLFSGLDRHSAELAALKSENRELKNRLEEQAREISLIKRKLEL